MDKSILLWNVYGDCINYNELTGHKNAVLEVGWGPDSTFLLSCSADTTVALWDALTGQRVRKFVDHKEIVHSVCPSSSIESPLCFVAASEDGSALLYDTRTKHYEMVFETKYPLTACCFGSRDDNVVTGGLDNNIRVWDLKKPNTHRLQLSDHKDTITCVRLSPDGNFVLSNSMDGTMKIFDVRPFVVDEKKRCKNTFTGVVHGIDKNLLKCAWGENGQVVGVGGADRMVQVWRVRDEKLLYKLPGHKGTVNEVDFHNDEPILVSGSDDRQVFLGEFEP
eukprot:TRINITY_DN5259_c0_g1_i1.p1 TRINITY_DN5259_c0_g1~~TRINITY_DN5259_c0_g1_i1.p1  ORF type:complete len:279 (+),score=45.50 TRINITY_DN5259_c0_g1_i1:405-1241(+)